MSTRASKFDRSLDELASGIKSLSRRRQSAFFAACGEGLLPLYKQFHAKTKWGDVAPLQEALDTAWGYALGALVSAADDLLLRLENVTPHGEDFETILVTYAQDAVICVDCAIRPAVRASLLVPNCVCYALEPLQRYLTLNRFGYCDLGSNGLSDAWEDQIAEEGKMKLAIDSAGIR